jgi:hypothetical protein
LKTTPACSETWFSLEAASQGRAVQISGCVGGEPGGRIGAVSAAGEAMQDRQSLRLRSCGGQYEKSREACHEQAN